MPQFADRIMFGYKVRVRPSNDIARRFAIIPKLRMSIIPYFAGGDLEYQLKIIPTKKAIPCKTLNYEWFLFKKGDEEPCNSSSGSVDMSSSQVHEGQIYLGHFSYTDEYRLDMVVNVNEKTECRTIFDFEITSRAAFQLKFFWFLAGTIIGVVIGYMLNIR